MILPATDHTLELRSGTDAAAFLGRLPIADPTRTHEALTRFFHTLVHHPLPPLEQAPVLAQAEKALIFVQEEAARRYLARPLPYTDQELPLFQRTVQLWQDATAAWLAAVPGSGSDADTAAILERALFCHGMALVEHLQARFQIPAGLWRAFHDIYVESERRQVADLVFQDPHGHHLSCIRSYAAVLLFDLSKPYSLRSRDIPIVWRWSRAMARLVGLSPLAPDMPARVIVNLDSDQPMVKATPDAALHPGSRRLDTSDLANYLRKLRGRLAEGATPSQLYLGEDVSAGDASRLLSHLKYPWTQEAIARPTDVSHPMGECEVILGYDAIHFRLTGREARRPQAADPSRQYSHQDAEHLALFGVSRNDASSARDSAASRYVGERWQLLQQDAQAFRLHRPGAGARVAVGQLAAIAPDNGPLVLTRISSLMQTATGELIAKARRLPGRAMGVAIRALGSNPPPQATVGGFVMQGEGMNLAPTPELVIPRGWYLKRRPVELDSTPPKRCHLDKILFSGHDFDLVECVDGEPEPD